MSTATTHPPGAILTRKTLLNDDYDELLVIGAGKKIVVTSITAFTTSFELDANEAFHAYNVEIPEGVYKAAPVGAYPGLSPEEQFRQVSATEAVARGEDPTKIKSATRMRTSPISDAEVTTVVETETKPVAAPDVKTETKPVIETKKTTTTKVKR